jgi:hypothetical protein
VYEQEGARDIHVGKAQTWKNHWEIRVENPAANQFDLDAAAVDPSEDSSASPGFSSSEMIMQNCWTAAHIYAKLLPELVKRWDVPWDMPEDVPIHSIRSLDHTDLSDRGEQYATLLGACRTVGHAVHPDNF